MYVYKYASYMHKYGTQNTQHTKNYISQFQIDCMLKVLFGEKVVAGRGWTMMDMH